MKRPRITPQAACGWLQQQLDELDQFRNASTRDAQFKQWRQSTLTVIHRIWPGVTARSTRFRRIPFSPPSTLADARLTREAFERGCSEATLLMRGWITEIQAHGIVLETAAALAPSSDELHSPPTLTLEGEAPRMDPFGEVLHHDVPTIDLPAAELANDSVVLKPSRSGTPMKAAKAKIPARAKAAQPKEAPVQVHAAKAAPKAVPKGARLKDMLGLGHLAAAKGAPDESKRLEWPMPADFGAGSDPFTIEMISPDTPAPPPSAPPPASSERPPLRRFEGSPLEIPEATDRVAPMAGSAPSMPGLRPPPPPLDLLMSDDTPPASPPSPEWLNVAELELTVVDSISPAREPLIRKANLAGAAEIAALAAEVAHHDVPAAECERVRRALLDLAHAIERGQPSWDALRAVTVIVMHYPRLARRAMPVLLPFLDHTA